MKRWVSAALLTAILSTGALAFWKQQHKPGEAPPVPESYSAEELSRQQGQRIESRQIGREPSQMTQPSESLEHDDGAAGNLAGSSSGDSALTSDGENVLKQVDSDLKHGGPAPWWKWPLVLAACMTFGLGAFYGLSRWAGKATESVGSPLPPKQGPPTKLTL